MLLGDSHAEHLFAGVAKSWPEKNVAFYLLDLGEGARESRDNSILGELLASPETSLVVISFHFVAWKDLGAEKMSRLAKRAQFIVGQLKKSGKAVVLVGDIPRFELDASHCLYKSAQNKHHHKCSIPLEVARDQKNSYIKITEKIKLKNELLYIDIFDLMCDANSCSMIRGDKILYRDNNHLNVYGSLYVGGM